MTKAKRGEKPRANFRTSGNQMNPTEKKKKKEGDIWRREVEKGSCRKKGK